MRIVLSCETEISWLPSGIKSTLATIAVCPPGSKTKSGFADGSSAAGTAGAPCVAWSAVVPATQAAIASHTKTGRIPAARRPGDVGKIAGMSIFFVCIMFIFGDSVLKLACDRVFRGRIIVRGSRFPPDGQGLCGEEDNVSLGFFYRGSGGLPEGPRRLCHGSLIEVRDVPDRDGVARIG